MIDLETFGTKPGCALVSIGAVFFDPKTGDLGHELYTVVSRSSCEERGLHIDAGTVKWWSGQSEAARTAFDESCASGAPLEAALDELTRFIKLEKNVRVWGNGNDFDKPVLTAAYHACGLSEPWRPYNGRCYRTMKQLFKAELGREGVAHNALDDAKHQARHLIEIVRKHGLELA